MSSGLKSSAIIVAAGRGTRMGENRNKLFLPIHGIPVIAHTWNAFDKSPDIDDIILVVREETMSDFKDVADEFGFNKPYQFVMGGAERQDSVWNGLEGVSHSDGLVAIHDGARPCVSESIIHNTLNAAASSGAAVAASEPADTIKLTRDGMTIDEHLDRSQLRLVQTPQCFQVSIIRKALVKARESGQTFTDDTAACGGIGQEVQLVISSDPNIKITTPGDLKLAEAFLSPL